ncbi:MAG: septal ring lytic transglycosylase RlpA family protein [Patescibacteria group bacterium]
MKLRQWVLGLALSLLFPSLVFSEGWYPDVNEAHMYWDGIWYMDSNDYVQGYDDGNFYPMNTVNRAEALKMILNATEKDLVDQELSFTDINPEAWYIDYVETGVSLGIVNGYPDGSFKPDNTINRAEAVKMLLNASGILVELTEGDWYQPYMDYATANALLIPDSAGNFHPEALVSRGELCDMINRLQKGGFSGDFEFGKATYYAGIFIGDHTADGSLYDGTSLTAAHKTLPFGTVIRVTNLATSLSVDVTINDRGPYVDGYIVDLSTSAFDQIGALSTGVLDVRVEILEPSE